MGSGVYAGRGSSSHTFGRAQERGAGCPWLLEIAVKAPACLSWLCGHLSVCHWSWPGRSLRFLGLTSWFGSGSAALLPSKEREHGPGDFWEVARLRSESHIPEAWGPASVARDAVPCCQPALAPLGRPTACCFSFRLLLAPASTNKTANRLWRRPSLSSPSCVPEEAVRMHFGVPFTP